MRGLRAITVGIFLFSILFGVNGSMLASEPNVRVNEVLPDPEGRDNDTEFIEIKNLQKQDLSGWTIYIQTKDESQKDAEQIVLNDSIDTKTKFIVLDEEIGYLNNERVEVYIHDSTDTQVGPVLEYPAGDRENPKEATSYGFTKQSDGVVALDTITKGKPNTQESQKDQSNTEQKKDVSKKKKTSNNSEQDQTTEDTSQRDSSSNASKDSSKANESSKESSASSSPQKEQVQNEQVNTKEKTNQDDTSESKNEQSSSSEEKKESQERTSSTKTENQNSPENQENQNKNKDQSDKSKDSQSESEESSSSTDSVNNDNTKSSGSTPRDTENQSSDSSSTKTQSNTEQETRSKDESKEKKSYNGSNNLRIQSLVPNPNKSDGTHEQLTLRNYGTTDINLNDWAILRRNGTSREASTTTLPDISIEGTESKELSASQIPSLINTPTQIVLYSVINPDGDIVDNVYYTQAPEGKSYVYQKDTETMEWVSSQAESESNDQKSVQSSQESTQERSNSSEQSSQQKRISKEDISVHEVFPNPQNQADEFIELKVKVDSEYSLKGWALSDGTTTAKIEKHSLTTIYPTFTRKETGIALNNHQPETIALIAPDGNKVDTVEVKNQKPPLSYAYIDNTWKWTTSQTPGKTNTITHPAQSKKDSQTQETESRESQKSPSQRNKDSSENEEPNTQEPNTSSPEDNTDEHRSLNTNISVTLNEVFPSPADKLTEEFIELNVNEESQYSLKGWKLSDGTTTKSLSQTSLTTTYPTFTREDTGIALNNHRSETITLYAPNGDQVDSVELANQNEQQAYAYTGRTWKWTTSPTPNKANTISKKSQPKENVESKEAKSRDNSNKTPEEKHTSNKDKENDASNSDTSSSKNLSERRTSLNTDLSVNLNEIFPYPEGEQTKEFIELRVQDHDSYSLKGWVLTDGTRSVELEDTIRNTSYPVFQRSETQIALNNHSSETIQLLNPHGEAVDSVQITNQKADASYAFHQDEWQWTGTPTKQTSNTITDISSNQKTTDEQSDSQKEKSQSYQSVDEISEIFKKEHERNVQVTGTVYLVPGSVSDRFFVLSDEKRALKVYNFSQKFPEMKEGDIVTVKGEVYTKHEETRLVTNKQQVTVTDTSSQLDIPKEVSANRQSITPSNQGQEVRLTGELLEQSGDSFYMRTSTNRELRIAILPNVKMKKPDMRAGDTVSVSGLIDVYRDDVRILTWRESSIVPHNSQEEKSDTENTDTQDEGSKEPAPTSNSSSSHSSYELDQLLKDAPVQEGHIYSNSVAARMSSYLPPALKNHLQRYPFLVGVMSMVGLWICGEILRYIVRKRLT